MSEFSTLRYRPSPSVIDTYVLVLLDLVPRAPVTLAVPGDLGALREAVEVVAGAGDGTRDDDHNREGLGRDVLAEERAVRL